MTDSPSGTRQSSIDSFGIVCGVLGAVPMCLIVGVEIYGDLTNSGAGFIAFILGLFLCIPCLALAACSLYAGLRMVRRNSRAHAPIKKSVVPVVLGVVIVGAVIGMFVTGFLGPSIGIGPGG